MDYVCVKSGILCPRCQRLVDTGKVDREEVDVMKALIELEEEDPEFKWLKDARYVKSYFSPNLVVVILETRAAGPHQVSKLARILGDKLGVKVKVATSISDPKMLVAQLLYPARVQGLNTLWLPDGSTRYNIRIPRRDLRHLPSKPEELERILSLILKTPVKIKAE